MHIYSEIRPTYSQINTYRIAALFMSRAGFPFVLTLLKKLNFGLEITRLLVTSQVTTKTSVKVIKYSIDKQEVLLIFSSHGEEESLILVPK